MALLVFKVSQVFKVLRVLKVISDLTERKVLTELD